MGEHTEAFVGIDAAKARDAIAVAEGGRGGETRYLGGVDASEPGIRRIVARIASKHDHDPPPNWSRPESGLEPVPGGEGYAAQGFPSGGNPP